MKLNAYFGGLALALTLLSSNCEVATMEVSFIPSKTGLQAGHASQTPLLEQIYHPPGTSTEEVMRVYPDGGLYFYGPADSIAKQWGYLTKVKPVGVSQLTALFEDVCDLGAAPAAQGHNLGSVTYRFHTEACTKEVVIHGIDYGDYAALERVTEIVNGNLEKMFRPGR